MRASAHEIARALNGIRSGSGWVARCPAHQDRSPSLSISETANRAVLVHCHAGCEQGAVLAALAGMGLWGKGERQAFTVRPSYAGNNCEDTVNFNRAMELWEQAVPLAGTHGEAYLRARGIRGRLSSELRFIPNLKHREASEFFPVMLARLSDDNGFRAVQRTYLDRNHPTKAPLRAPMRVKKSLGSQGSAAVRLKPVTGDTLGLAEGIETALSAGQLYAMPVWATLSAARLARVQIPETVRFIHIFGDPKPQERDAAFKAGEFYESQGRHVEIYFPEAHFKVKDGADFNDVVRAG